MRNSWAPRVVALVTLLVFSLSDVAFGVPVCPAPGNNKTSPGTQTSSHSTAPKNGSTLAEAASDSNNSGAPNFGKCPPPEIKFGVGNDDRVETSFAPADQAAYNHGSVDNIPILTQFMCDNLVNSCGANQPAKNLCAQARAAANDATPALTGIQADTFNKFFGIKTDFAAVQPITDHGVPLVVPGAKSAPSSNPVNSATSSAPNPAKTGAAQHTAGNLQTFTGELGGVAAPVVTAAGNGKFQVQGNALFNDLQSALQRSCDVQHNLCADAANASRNQGELTVANCGTQQSKCSAAASA